MTIRMGYWDCPGCSNKRIQGPERGCPSCGRPRDADVAFYTDDDAPTIEAPEQVARARSGADWHCPYCGADNPRGTVQCVGCGASSADAKARTEKVILDQPAPVTKSSEGGGGKGVVLGLAIVAAMFALIITGVWMLFIRAKPLEVTVERATWVKAIHIERLDTQTKEAWRDEVPSGAREVRRFTDHRRKHVQVGTEKVKVGKKDLGNGYFEDIYKEQPKFEDRLVEDTRVVYEIDRWVQDRTLKNQSDDGHEPEYPRFSPGVREKIAQKEDKIALELKGDNGKSYDYEIDLAAHPTEKQKLGEYTKGRRFKALVNAVGGVRGLEPS